MELEENMHKLSYEEAQRLERYTNKKLFDFMNDNVEIDKALKEINSEYPFFSDESKKTGFKLWLSIDYINKDGKSFIEKFLESNSNNLNQLERDLLVDRNNSFISLFEIMGFEDESLILLDSLQNKEYIVCEPQMSKVTNAGDFLFARIGKLLDEYYFIGEINYLPENVKPLFIEEFLYDFNAIRKDNPELIIRDYQKKYSLSLIRNYNNCIFNAIENDEDINALLYDELNEFEGYLKNRANNLTIGKHISNLIEFFEYYLVEEDLTLYDLDQLDFKSFFQDAIEDGFINSQEGLNSYISTLKRYMNFLSNRSIDYKEAYQELKEISDNRFTYMENLKKNSSPFNIDRILESHVADALNESAINFLINFDRFILYTFDKEVELTSIKKQIKRKYLLELNDLIHDKSFSTKGNPNQEDLPIIHMFFKIALRLEMMEIQKNKLKLTKRGTNFIRLKDEEKFSLLFSCLWDKDFINEVTTIESNLIELTKRDFVNLANTMVENKSYSVALLISENKCNPDNLLQINEYLKILGLIKSIFYPSYSWEVTKLGKRIFKYLYDRKFASNDDAIIDLDNYRKSKKS